MKQYEAVISTLERLGGQATLAVLYREVLKIIECEWGTKTPFASIRRIVQTRPEIFKVRPGLWALKSFQKKLGISEYNEIATNKAAQEQNHSYYQGLLVQIGNLRGMDTYVPNQDRNKLFINDTLGDLRSLEKIPAFSYEHIIHRSSTIDVIWFNKRQMPESFFEVEYSTDIQNSLLKFNDLQDFNSKMFIVADEVRNREFEKKIKMSALDSIKDRVNFMGYNALVKLYEYQTVFSMQGFKI